MWSGTRYRPYTRSGRPARPLDARYAVTSSIWDLDRVASLVNTTGGRCGARYGWRVASRAERSMSICCARSTVTESGGAIGGGGAFRRPNGFCRRSLNWSLLCWLCHAISSAVLIEAICSSDSITFVVAEP
jgi:hypothetical protein